MKYEKTNDANFLGKWRYHVQMAFYFDWVTSKGARKGKVERWKTPADQQGVENVEFYLRKNAHNAWQRVGNNFYFESLNEAFAARLYFDEHIRFIREAGRFQRNAPAH